LGQRKIFSFKTGDLLKKGLIHRIFFITGKEIGDLCNKGDCLIEVISWAGLTVHIFTYF
jgi:hypothetical protein